MLQAAKLMNCPPWQAAGMSENRHPLYWQRWAITIAEAEGKARQWQMRNRKSPM